LFGFVLTKAIHVAAKLNIADIIGSEGPLAAADIANRAGANEESVSRLLRALASAGIFKVNETGKYLLTPLAETLREDNPESIKAMALVLGDMLYKAYDELLFSVKTGEGGFTRALGVPVFQYLANNHETGKLFDRMMTDIHGGETQPMVDAYDFSGFGTVVDIGGGNGEVISAILKRHEAVKGILFDLPEVIDRARNNIAAHGFGDRCQLVTGNFFNTIVKEGDAYIMRHILHDWSDEDAIAILSNCRKAMNVGGKVLVVEAVIQQGNEPSPFKLLDLTMLLIGGKERTESQFGNIFSKAGLKLNRIVPFQHDLSVVEGIAV
ncbi:MAG: methyltransferase domain-containing protein, partial [Chitinophagaceae bacterium]